MRSSKNIELRVKKPSLLMNKPEDTALKSAKTPLEKAMILSERIQNTTTVDKNI